jgi:hypothetical protein
MALCMASIPFKEATVPTHATSSTHSLYARWRLLELLVGDLEGGWLFSMLFTPAATVAYHLSLIMYLTESANAFIASNFI